jgi:hypothetical protein
MKVNKKAAVAKKEVVEKKEAAPEFKYGVDDLAKALGVEAASVRVKLRNNEIPRAGRSYGWNTKAELEEVLAVLNKKKEAAPAKKAKAKEETEEAPAKAVKKVKKVKKEMADAE